MNTVAISLGIKQWIPPTGNVRLNVSPEMAAKKTIAKKQSEGRKSGKHKTEDGKSNRQRIVELLSDGNRYTLREVGENLKLSFTTVARHLIDLVDTSVAQTSSSIARGSWANPTTYWIAK